MRVAFAILLGLHAAIHLLGVAKGFGLAAISELTLPISRAMSAVWLGAAVSMFGAAAALFVAPRWFWAVGALAMVLSQVAIVSSWADARFGTLPNALLLLVVLFGAFAWGPAGLRAEYEGLVRGGLARATAVPPVVTEADLAALPGPVQRYLRFAGVVGAPRPVGFRARMTGRIRGSATAPWMPFTAEQHNLYDPSRRYFWMVATRGGLPVDGLHVFGEAGATMRIRLLSLVPVVDQGGAALTRTETVTVLNDMAVFAPARLLDPAA